MRLGSGKTVAYNITVLDRLGQLFSIVIGKATTQRNGLEMAKGALTRWNIPWIILWFFRSPSVLLRNLVEF
jgi:hypothetical protein